MLILGHTGITLGAAVLLNGALTNRALSQPKGNSKPSSKMRTTPDYLPGRIVSWFTSLGNRIDIRLLLIGSLLPDIIDKPVGQLLFRETFSNSRIFSHSLLFLIVIALAGFFVYRIRGKIWLTVLSFGTFTHLVFDQMWLEQRTLLWPFYGFAFERVDTTHWVQGMSRRLLTDPAVYVPEIVGGIILVLFVWVVVNSRKMIAFIRNGKF